MIRFHFWSVQSITITQKTVIDCNRLRLTITITPCSNMGTPNLLLAPGAI